MVVTLHPHILQLETEVAVDMLEEMEMQMEEKVLGKKPIWILIYSS